MAGLHKLVDCAEAVSDDAAVHDIGVPERQQQPHQVEGADAVLSLAGGGPFVGHSLGHPHKTDIQDILKFATEVI